CSHNFGVLLPQEHDDISEFPNWLTATFGNPTTEAVLVNTPALSSREIGKILPKSFLSIKFAFWVCFNRSYTESILIFVSDNIYSFGNAISNLQILINN